MKGRTSPVTEISVFATDISVTHRRPKPSLIVRNYYKHKPSRVVTCWLVKVTPNMDSSRNDERKLSIKNTTAINASKAYMKLGSRIFDK